MAVARRRKTAVTAIVGAAVVLPTHFQPDGVVIVEGDRIVAAGARASTPVPRGAKRIDARGKVVTPGLVDLHINGFGGVDVFGASRAGITKMGAALAAHGVTAFVPTVVTSPFPALLRAIARLTQIVEAPPADGAAEPLGVYVEGPFLSDAKRGAHPSQDLRAPRKDALAQLTELMGTRARILAIAPELPGAHDAIRELARAGVVVALGHSEADAEVCRQAVSAGATHVVHLFNAMGPVHHRSAGLAGFTLGSGDVTAEIIADGHHVDRWMIAAAWRALGPERLALVSDAIAPAGLPIANGASVRLESGLGRVTIRRSSADGSLPRAETSGGLLAGSVVSLADCLRHAVHRAGVPLFDAVKMAAETPARIAGVSARKGSIAPGRDADLVLFDADLRVETVWTRGTLVKGSRK